MKDLSNLIKNSDWQENSKMLRIFRIGVEETCDLQLTGSTMMPFNVFRNLCNGDERPLRAGLQPRLVFPLASGQNNRIS